MSTKGLMISYMIGAMEVQDVATYDIPGAFLQTNYVKGEILVTLLEDIELT